MTEQHPHLEAAFSEVREAQENESRSEAQAMMWAGRAEAAESLLKEAREALERIVRESESHSEFVDDLDDDGAHVGYAKYERAKAEAKAVCASIARAALAKLEAR